MISDARIDKVMDETGMDRLQAYRHLAQRDSLSRYRPSPSRHR